MMGLEELITEMELKRARAGIGYRKMAFKLEASKEEYLNWLDKAAEPNKKQLNLIVVWVSDYLELEEAPDDNTR